MPTSTPFYEQVIEATLPYLGPSSKRFIDRQIISHLHIEPADLSRADISRLVDWVSIAMSFLTDDRKMIDEFVTELEKLGAQKPTAKKGLSK